MSNVREWPRLPNLELTESLRDALEAEREETGLSMAELMRQALCAHYKLRCEEVHSFGGQAPASGHFTLRVSPELFRALNRDKRKTGASMRALVLEVLNDFYVTEGTPV